MEFFFDRIMSRGQERERERERETLEINILA
jgi:hypothetical protein